MESQISIARRDVVEDLEFIQLCDCAQSVIARESREAGRLRHTTHAIRNAWGQKASSALTAL